LPRDREDTQAPTVLRTANLRPGDFTLTPMTGFFTHLEESATSFVNGFKDPSTEETRGHGMGHHGGKDSVDENKASPNGKGASPPPREVHITFRNNGVKVS
jgi:hypothetical protein